VSEAKKPSAAARRRGGKSSGSEKERNHSVLREKDADPGPQDRNFPVNNHRIYRAIFEHTGTAMLIFEEDATIRMVNRKLADLLGYAREELEGRRRWTEFVPDEDRERMLDYARRRRAGDKTVPVEYEFRFLRRDGAVRRGIVNVILLPESGRTLASVIDITDHYALEEERRRYEFIVNASQDSMNLIDASYVYRAVNNAAIRMHGISRQKIIGRTVAEVWGKKVFQRDIKPLLDQCLAGKTVRKVFTSHLPSGEKKYFSASFYPYYEDGRVTHAVVVSRDITDEKRLADNVARSEDSLKQAQRIAHLGNWDWDITGKSLMWSDELYRIFGITPKKGGVPFRSFLMAVHPEDRREISQAIKASLETGKAYERDFRIVRPDGTLRYVHADADVIYGKDKKPTRMIGTVLDITERKQAEMERDRQKAKLDYMALHDPLTGLPNRAFLARELNASSGSHESVNPSALIYIGIDRFKAINETLGHHAGDRILKSVAKRLASRCRESDLLVRMGGDVFALLLTPLDDEDYPIRIAREIQRLFSEPLGVGGFTADIEVTMGVGLQPDKRPGAAESLLQRAEVAMYAAKRTHSPYLLYEPEMEQYSLEYLALAGELKNAISNNELVLHYQPQVDMRTARIIGVEALVRWNHPRKGFISPNLFIQIAEQTGLIHPITQWIVGEALRQLGIWQKQGTDVVMSINLAAPNLQDILLPDEFEQLIKRINISPSKVSLEITESMLMTDPERSRKALARLHEMGFKLAIDDFGTGYSSLAYLKDMPVDELKIDKSFVLGIPKDKKKLMIVRTIVELAHNLGYRVIAEGVEEAAQWHTLKELGCDITQGFLISQPLEARTFEQWERGFSLHPDLKTTTEPPVDDALHTHGSGRIP